MAHQGGRPRNEDNMAPPPGLHSSLPGSPGPARPSAPDPGVEPGSDLMASQPPRPGPLAPRPPASRQRPNLAGPTEGSRPPAAATGIRIGMGPVWVRDNPTPSERLHRASSEAAAQWEEQCRRARARMAQFVVAVTAGACWWTFVRDTPVLGWVTLGSLGLGAGVAALLASRTWRHRCSSCARHDGD